MVMQWSNDDNHKWWQTQWWFNDALMTCTIMARHPICFQLFSRANNSVKPCLIVLKLLWSCTIITKWWWAPRLGVQVSKSLCFFLILSESLHSKLYNCQLTMLLVLRSWWQLWIQLVTLARKALAMMMTFESTWSIHPLLCIGNALTWTLDIYRWKSPLKQQWRQCIFSNDQW